MNVSSNRWIRIALWAVVGWAAAWNGEAAAQAAKPESSTRLPTADEARGRAELLHDAVEQLLQVVHHRYYREDEGLQLPAAALKDVFKDLAERRGVELRWLAVEGQAMNVAHLPRDDFEKQAVKAMLGGESAFEATADGKYRRAAVIALTNECLKCHVPNRTSTRDRAAGLVITLPVRAE